MISKGCIKNLFVAIALTLVSTVSYTQVTSGRIVFERKTNLQKKFAGDERMKRFITKDTKSKVERFELIFNDTMSAFIPIVSDVEEEGGWMSRYLTSQNHVYMDLSKNEKLTILDFGGEDTYIKDPIAKKEWKVTESKRNIGSYDCRKAIWHMNDSTRIYAWFSVDIVPSIGPEGFGGLPGAILGLATEDGGVIYFAKEVTIEKPDPIKLVREIGKNDVYTKAELRESLEKNMSQWVKPKDLDAMFSWL